MQASHRLPHGRRARIGKIVAAVTAASGIALGSTALMAQEVRGPNVGVQAQASATPVAAAKAQAPAASGSALPTINVNAEKPARTARRQAATQGPNREPIKIPVTSAGCKSVRAPGKPYFIEFRSRTAVSFGHTFVLHGRLGGGNRYASFQVAGLHPKGDDPNIYMRGMMVPVESETGVSWGDLDEQYLTARFCVTLTEAEYRKALAYIKHLQATKKTWHATTYNCNSFAADIARHIGLDSPNPNMYLPETFINRMASLNPGGKASNPFSVGTFGFQQTPQAQSQPQRRRTAQPGGAQRQAQ